MFTCITLDEIEVMWNKGKISSQCLFFFYSRANVVFISISAIASKIEYPLKTHYTCSNMRLYVDRSKYKFKQDLEDSCDYSYHRDKDLTGCTVYKYATNQCKKIAINKYKDIIECIIMSVFERRRVFQSTYQRLQAGASGQKVYFLV